MQDKDIKKLLNRIEQLEESNNQLRDNMISEYTHVLPSLNINIQEGNSDFITKTINIKVKGKTLNDCKKGFTFIMDKQQTLRKNNNI